MPLSYGCSLTGLGRFGARKRDKSSGTTGKITATTRKRAIGPNVPSTRGQYTQGRRAAGGQAYSGRERRVADPGREAALRDGDVRSHRQALRPDEHAHDGGPGPALAANRIGACPPRPFRLDSGCGPPDWSS